MRSPRWLLQMAFTFSFVILVLLLISFPFINRDSGTYVVAIFTLGLTLITMLGVVVVVLVDRRLYDQK